MSPAVRMDGGMPSGSFYISVLDTTLVGVELVGYLSMFRSINRCCEHFGLVPLCMSELLVLSIRRLDLYSGGVWYLGKPPMVACMIDTAS